MEEYVDNLLKSTEKRIQERINWINKILNDENVHAYFNDTKIEKLEFEKEILEKYV